MTEDLDRIFDENNGTIGIRRNISNIGQNLSNAGVFDILPLLVFVLLTISGNLILPLIRAKMF